MYLIRKFLLLSFIVFVPHISFATQISNNSKVFINALVFDGKSFLTDFQAVVIVDGIVESVTPMSKYNGQTHKLKEQDINGQVLIPGLIDAHAHIRLPEHYIAELALTGKSNANCTADKKLSRIDIGGTFQNLINGKYVGDIEPDSLIKTSLRFGVTTIFDVDSGSGLSLRFQRSRDKWGVTNNNGSVSERADLFSEFITYPDVYAAMDWAAPKHDYARFGRIPVYKDWSKTDYKRWIQARIESGSDYLKVYYDDKHTFDPDHQPKENWPELTFDQVKTLVEVSAEVDPNFKIVTHVLSIKETKEVLRAGVHGLVHQFVDEEYDEEVIELFKSSGAFLVPTLGIMLGDCKYDFAATSHTDRWPGKIQDDIDFGKKYVSMQHTIFDKNKALVEPYLTPLDELRLYNCYGMGKGDRINPYAQMFRTLARLKKEGVTILAGSDNGGSQVGVHGISLHWELYLIKEAFKNELKLSESEAVEMALQTATGNTWRAFGIGKSKKGMKEKPTPRGKIAKGYRADMILLSKDPRKNIMNTLSIEKIWKAGFEITRDIVRKPAPESKGITASEVIQNKIVEGNAYCKAQ